MEIFSIYESLLNEEQVLTPTYTRRFKVGGSTVYKNPKNISEIPRGTSAILTSEGDFYIALEDSVTPIQLDSLEGASGKTIPFKKTFGSELILQSDDITSAREAIKNYRGKNNNLIRFKLSKYGIGM